MIIPDSKKKELVTIDYGDGDTTTFECDYLIAPLIRKLNNHKLWTRYCCSGHERDKFTSCYIFFYGLCYEGDEEAREKLNYLVSNSRDFFMPEWCLRIQDPRHKRRFPRVQLTDPTVRDMDAVSKLCLGVGFDDVFAISDDGQIIVSSKYENDVDMSLILRLTFWNDHERHSDRFEEVNYDHTLQGIRHLVKILDSI